MKLFKRRIRDWGIWKVIGMTAGGDNKVGEVIHGLLDWIPFPNQPVGKFIKAITIGDKYDVKVELSKMLSIRNTVALLVAIPVLLGWITLEDVRGWVQSIMDFLGLIKEILEILKPVTDTVGV